jgi:hypothetical protein
MPVSERNDNYHGDGDLHHRPHPRETSSKENLKWQQQFHQLNAPRTE